MLPKYGLYLTGIHLHSSWPVLSIRRCASIKSNPFYARPYSQISPKWNCYTDSYPQM